MGWFIANRFGRHAGSRPKRNRSCPASGASWRETSSRKPLRGFGGATVLEIVENFDGNTFRAVYTVRFAKAVYVLHVFQKKSKSGISTPRNEIILIKQRLVAALRHYETVYESQKQ